MASKENVSNNSNNEIRQKPTFVEDTGNAVPISWLDQSNFLPSLDEGDDSIFTALEGESSEVERLNFLYISGKTLEKQVRAQEELLHKNTPNNIASATKQEETPASIDTKKPEKPFSPFPQMQYLKNLKNIFS